MPRPIGAEPQSGLPGGAVWIDSWRPPETRRRRSSARSGSSCRPRGGERHPALDRLVARQGPLRHRPGALRRRATRPSFPVTFIRAGGRLVTLGYGAEDALGDLWRPGARRRESATRRGFSRPCSRPGRSHRRPARGPGRKLAVRPRTLRHSGAAAGPVARQQVSLGAADPPRCSRRSRSWGRATSWRPELRECLASLSRLAAFRRAARGAQGQPARAIEQDLHAITEYSHCADRDMSSSSTPPSG